LILDKGYEGVAVMIDEKRALEILENRIDIAENGGGGSPLNDWWKEMVGILSQNQQETEKFLEERTSKELFFLSELFEDIAYEFKTTSFIEFLWNLHAKHPEAEMEEQIKEAEEVIE
jgi:hypothetical protein